MKPLGINYLAATVDPQGMQQQSHIYQEALKKRLSQSNIGPGAYNVAGNLIREESDQFVSVQKKPPPAFNSGAARIDNSMIERMRREQGINPDTGMTGGSGEKPVYELQLLEGPQMKANRLFETIDTDSRTVQ